MMMLTAPSDLKRIYTACVARGQKLPVTFTVGAHPSISSPPQRASPATNSASSPISAASRRRW